MLLFFALYLIIIIEISFDIDKPQFITKFSEWIKNLSRSSENQDKEENKINIQSGSIDNHVIQNSIINIMEGGEEAFDKRRDIYNLWKH